MRGIKRLRRCCWLHGILAALSLFGLSSPFAEAASLPLPECHCFQIQYLLRLPNLEAKHFVHDVAHLQDKGNADPSSAQARIAALRIQADTLRHHEENCYLLAAGLLEKMGAPPSLQTWASAKSEQLSQPAPLSPDEQKEAKTDPNTAEILATLDEVNVLKSETDSQISSLGTWISLTHGPSGLWAADIGEMSAGIAAALADQAEPKLSILSLRKLRDKAPSGTPVSVHDALTQLLPQGGNLSLFLPGAISVSKAASRRSLQTLLKAFDAQSLQDKDIS